MMKTKGEGIVTEETDNGRCGGKEVKRKVMKTKGKNRRKRVRIMKYNTEKRKTGVTMKTKGKYNEKEKRIRKTRRKKRKIGK